MFVCLHIFRSILYNIVNGTHPMSEALHTCCTYFSAIFFSRFVNQTELRFELAMADYGVDEFERSLPKFRSCVRIMLY